MSYSLAEAAKATGTNKTTILRAVKSGKISGKRDEHGNWHLQPAEVHRVYEPVVLRRLGLCIGAHNRIVYTVNFRRLEMPLAVLVSLT